MTDRASIFQLAHWGREATPGSVTVANRILQSILVAPSIKIDTIPFTASAYKFPTLVSPSKEWTEARLSGPQTYSELQYLLASVMGTCAPAQNQGTGLMYTWTFTIDADAADSPATYTMGMGDTNRTIVFPYGLVNDLTLSWDRSKAEFTGNMIGQKSTESTADLDAGTVLADGPEPILPSQVNVYLEDTAAALGTATALTRCLKGDLSIASRFGPVWVLRSTDTSWAAHIETKPTVLFKLLLEADDTGMDLLTHLRAGSSKFIRVQATGDTIETIGGTAYPYKLTVDVAGKVSAIGDYTDSDGVYAIEWTFTNVYDTTWGTAIRVVLQNQAVTL